MRPLAALTSLRSLNLSGCRPTTGCAAPRRPTSLQTFRFVGCLLNCSPVAEPLSFWPVLRELYADRLLSAPSELGSANENSLPRIRAWQKDLLAGEAPNSTLKVLILGNGRIGKTQIRRRLMGREFDPSIPSTHGIGIEELQLAPAQGDQPEVRAKLWDFGGQSIYTGTHGLFLDDRAIYVIAWTPRYENADESEENGVAMRNRPLTYWLEYVRSLAGPRAPVIVTQTQCDRETEARTPPMPADHGFERLRITYSSAKQADGLERLQMELKSAARYQLEQYGKVRLPMRWCNVVQELDLRRQQKHKTISFEDFEAVCRTRFRTALPAAVLQYLHRSGQVFYRAGAFDNQVVLDLDWALDGIYAVLDRNRAVPIIRRQGGRFTTQLLAAQVWQAYTVADHDLFLSLMQQCQICFKVAENAYVAPALLPGETEVRADLEKVWRGARPEAVARLHYSFLHEGVLRTMLCSLGQKAGESAVYWAYGICFYDLETKATALIGTEFSDPEGRQPGGHITVEAAGGQALLLAERLVQSIQQVNIGRAPEVTWIKGGPEMKKGDEASNARPVEPFSEVKPGQVPTLPGESRPVYVSYAWNGESEALVDAIEKRLPANWKLFRDRRVLRPGDWIPRFMQEIGRAECVLVVFSEKYLRSIYCMRELLYLYQSSSGSGKIS